LAAFFVQTLPLLYLLFGCGTTNLNVETLDFNLCAKTRIILMRIPGCPPGNILYSETHYRPVGISDTSEDTKLIPNIENIVVLGCSNSSVSFRVFTTCSVLLMVNFIGNLLLLPLFHPQQGQKKRKPHCIWVDGNGKVFEEKPLPLLFCLMMD